VFGVVLLKIKSLISRGKKLTVVKNSLWNIIGQAVPLLSALVTIPILIKAIGDEKFGFLTIAWMLIGYFSLFDFGIGRAITYAVAKRVSQGKKYISDVLWTGLSFVFVIGLLVSGAIYFSSDWIVLSFIKLSPELEVEANNALKILSISIPFVILTTGLRGALEGLREFKIINLVRIPLGSLLFIAPAIVTQYSISLENIILSLFIVRFLNFLIFAFVCTKKIEGFLKIDINKQTLVELITFGGWMTVTNVVSPIMVYMDRLFIGAKMAVASVTFYVVPFDIISKLLLLPSSISGVVFPEFSHLMGTGQTEKLRQYFIKSVIVVFILLAPPLLFVFTFSYELLSWWISVELADKSSSILKILCIGILINGISYIPFALIQGMGRSDITAKFHLLELCIYAPVLYLFIDLYGLVGVALAWCMRVALDSLLLFSYSFKFLKKI
tara:strand:- start:16375 stop:17697 length:1323 start_codon:yes stop_codon:yes gene_type:complete